MTIPIRGEKYVPAWWDDGKDFLRDADPVMAGLIARFPQSQLVSRGTACETLVRAVFGQQISVKAAEAIWQRFLKLVGEVTPDNILAAADEDLRSVGVGFAKIRFIKGVAAGFADGTVRPGEWGGLDDDEVIAQLVKLPGIGRWTAEMFLIFHMARPDVLPLDDIGILKAFALHYGPIRGTAKLTGMQRWKKIAVATAKHGEKWRPYRSLAMWYLWRSLDPHEIVY